MALIPFASFSVHHFVSSVGADAGFAAFVAVAILVLLYFAHARETATLRARANEADVRIQELEAELAELSEQVAGLPAEISVRAANPRVAAAAVPSAAAAMATAGHGSALPPAAPAGVGAPALAAATRLIPDPIPAVPEYEPATAAGGNGNGSARPVVAASAATIQRPVAAPSGGTARPVGAPPRAGGRPGGGPGAGQGRPPRPGQPRPAGPARPSGAPLRPPPRRSTGRVVAGVAVGVLALVAVVVGVIALTGGGKGASSASKTSTSSAASLAASRRSAAGATTVRPATVTVSVLNGTDVQHLGHTVSDRLAADGYRRGPVANASIQQQGSTIVAYMAPADRADALAVAKSLKLTKAAVRLVDPATKATVCPTGQPCTTAVVVTVGQDLAQL